MPTRRLATDQRRRASAEYASSRGTARSTDLILVMARAALRRLITNAAATQPGRSGVARAAETRPDRLADALGYLQARDARISLDEWPQRRPSFYEIAPLLLSSSAANRGLASMRLDEIAFLVGGLHKRRTRTRLSRSVANEELLTRRCRVEAAGLLGEHVEAVDWGSGQRAAHAPRAPGHPRRRPPAWMTASTVSAKPTTR